MNNHRASYRLCPAFTLIEVMIAMTLLIALLGMMFGFVNNLLSSRDRIKGYANQQLATSILIERIEAELMTSVVGDSVSGSGVKGDESSIQILSRSVAASLASNGTNDPDVFYDLQRSDFRFNEDSHQVDGRKVAAGSKTQSNKRYWPIGYIYRVRFRYYHNNEWQDSFDSLKHGHLPQAIEVAVWFVPWPGESENEDDYGYEEADDGIDYNDDEEEFDRLTYDMDDVFDENEYANMLADELIPPPPPDRVRVIVIPDSEEEDDSSLEFDERMGDEE